MDIVDKWSDKTDISIKYIGDKHDIDIIEQNINSSYFYHFNELVLL